mmetsp:Transcript_104030/g.294750  ORF Transcript_104030/g.294750 Transcript_104030/m.294750 type:complete len:226 (+) Transcript_104030:172-849(+)
MARRVLNELVERVQVADTMHIDADAFVMKNPVRALSEGFPDFDIVGSTDCVRAVDPLRYAGDSEDNPWCAWYVNQDYLARHAGGDPLSDRGFMLNSGFALFRSNPAVREFLGEMQARKKPGVNEQIAINELLLDWGCTWTTSSGDPAPRGASAMAWLRSEPLHGSCLGSGDTPLRVAVLPYSVVPRETPVREGSVGPETVAWHPGGSLAFKLRQLPRTTTYCGPA